jgi:hypothetical protein
VRWEERSEVFLHDTRALWIMETSVGIAEKQILVLPIHFGKHQMSAPHLRRKKMNHITASFLPHQVALE